MTIEQAIIYIIQHANAEQKQWACDVILGKQSLEQNTTKNTDFFFPTFKMGSHHLPNREEIYDEVCERHFRN